MPMNRKLYPKNWDEIALQVKTKANWTCEECKRPCRRPGEDDSDLIERIQTNHPDRAKDLHDWHDDDEFGAIEIPKLTRFTLTTAHLNHIPEDCRPENLKALCSVCHCRMDLKAMPLKRRLKMERNGQLSLDMLTAPEPAGHGKDSTRVQMPIRRAEL